MLLIFPSSQSSPNLYILKCPYPFLFFHLPFRTPFLYRGVCVCVCVFCFWLCLATVCLHHLSLNFPSCIRLGRCFRACCNAYPTLYLGPKFHMHVYVHCICVTCITYVHSGSYIWVYRLCKQSIRRDELKWEWRCHFLCSSCILSSFAYIASWEFSLWPQHQLCRSVLLGKVLIFNSSRLLQLRTQWWQI